MTFVVDASVAIKWFVQENLHEAAKDLLENGEDFQAPDLIVAEVANVAWKKARRGEIMETQATAIVSALRGYIPNLQPSAALADRAMAMALELDHPVYDCLYLACAEFTGKPLITADRRLYELDSGTSLGPSIRYLGDSP